MPLTPLLSSPLLFSRLLLPSSPASCPPLPQVLWDYRQLWTLLFTYYAVSGGSLNLIKLNAWNMLLDDARCLHASSDLSLPLSSYTSDF